jgi:hypothetical protein
MAQIGDRKFELERSLLRYSELPVVPIRYVDDNKVPLQGWEYGKWKDGGQSEEDRRRAIELFERGECDGLAIVCGTPVHEDGERLYFFAIDIDLPAEEAARALGRAGIVTRFEKTLRGRLHAYFFSRSPTPNLPDMIDPKTGEKVLEFKGKGRLIVVYPSIGYNRLNENQPKPVDDALEIYGEICRVFGFDLEEKLQQEAQGPRETVTDSGILSEWLEQIVEELQRRGLKPRRGPNYYSVLCPFHEERHPSFAINHRKFYAVDYHDDKVYNMRGLAKALGLQLVTEPEVRAIDARVDEPFKPRERAILSFVFPDGRVAEAIGIRNALGEYDPALLILGPEGFRVEHEIVNDGTIFRGANSDPYEPYVIEDLENVKSRAELVNEIYAEVNRFIDANPKEKAIFTAYILLSYCPELFKTVPYLYLVGDNESGKSHVLDLFNYLCYRPLYGVSVPAADIYSYLGKEKSDPPLTILEDEFQGSDRDTEKMKIYKAGYKRGARVPRIAFDSDGRRRREHYNAFGPKVVAAEELIENKGFLERCIVIEMAEGEPEKDHYDEEDEARFARLRSELLKWRMAVLAGREKLPQLKLEWLKKRNRQLYLPLLTVLEGTPLYSILEEYIREEIKRKREEKRSSLEAAVWKAAKNVADKYGGVKPGLKLSFSEIWDKFKALTNALSPSPSAFDPEDKVYIEAFGWVTKVKFAKTLQKLGFKKAGRELRDGKQETMYEITDAEKIRRLAIKYGDEDQPTLNILNSNGKSEDPSR